MRCPEGVAGECFYQKHAGMGVPDAIRRVHIRERTKSGEYLVVDTLPAVEGCGAQQEGLCDWRAL